MIKSLYACEAVIYPDKAKPKKKSKVSSKNLIFIALLIAAIQMAIFICLGYIPNPAIGLSSLVFYLLLIFGLDVTICFTSSNEKLRKGAMISGVIFTILIVVTLFIGIL